jgi:DUF1680 family protein
MDRRTFLSTTLGIGTVAAFSPELANAAEPVRAASRRGAGIEPFSPGEVTLGPGPFRDALERNRRYLVSLPVDRLLHMFRVSSGLPSSAAPVGGWEKPDCDLRGHFTGHYLTACALMAAHAGDAELGTRGAETARALAACQKAVGNGYLGAYTEEQYDRLREGRRVWAPFYTLHKILAGHLALYRHTKSTDALAVAEGMAQWVRRYTNGLSDAHWQRMLKVEHGGMNEVLYDLAAATGKDEYLDLGHRFAQPSFFNPLAEGRDELTGLHVNTQIPKVIGAARRYELTGERRYRDIAEYFWAQVVGHRSYCIGNTSNGELWHTPPGVLAKELAADTAECCCAYNLLKLTRHLFTWTGEARYADYYERALFNCRLGTQHPGDGRLMYYLPLAPGYWKRYGSALDSFWCCTGTGVEEFAKTADSIYFRDGDGIYVNLFIPSEVRWPARGVRIRQDTAFPREGRSRLTVDVDRPTTFALRIRVPYWVSPAGSVTLNSQPLQAFSSPSSYLVLNRTWKSGDIVEVTLPMALHAAPMPDDEGVQAMMYGPLVLAGRLGTDGLTEDMQTGQYDADYSGAPAPVQDIVADPAGPPWVESVAGEPLAFRTAGQKREIAFVPLNAIDGERYAVYFNVADRAPLRHAQG